jgi:hypothetical protein
VTRVTLYGKAGCCLCDEAREVVAGVRERIPFHLEEVDISTDPVLHRRYGERIPVVSVNGEDVLELQVDSASLERVLGRVRV